MRSAAWYRIRNKLKTLPYSRKKEKGFTLIEMLVVIAIIGILTGGAITAYNNFNQSQTVRRAALGMVTDIRESQNRAVTGLKPGNCSQNTAPVDNISDYLLDGHYVTFTEGDGFYEVQAQCTVNTAEGQTASPSPYYYPDAPENIDMSRDVFIGSVAIPGCPTLSTLTINFLPLKKIEFYNGTDLSGTLVSGSAGTCPAALTAEVTVTDTVSTSTITVDLSGQVTED